MICKKCGAQTQVQRGRDKKGPAQAYERQRFCPGCGATFTTTERQDITVEFKKREKPKMLPCGMTTFFNLKKALNQ